MSPIMVIFILLTHWLADFVLQTDWMATNKSKNNWALTAHVAMYITPFIVVGAFVTLMSYSPWIGLLWLWGNATAHWITDYFTSRVNAKLWEKKEVHLFFVMIGLDQFIHTTTLLTTFYLLTK